MQRIWLVTLVPILTATAAPVLAHPQHMAGHHMSSHHMAGHHMAMHKGGGMMKWMDGTGVGLPKGSQVAVVSGDPTKAGDFTVQLKFPADFMVPPHSHPGDEEVRVVSGGPLHYGMGDKADMAKAASLEKGYHVTLGAGMNHWAHAPVATVVQVNGKGPFAITYVNPADDPRMKK